MMVSRCSRSCAFREDILEVHRKTAIRYCTDGTKAYRDRDDCLYTLKYAIRLDPGTESIEQYQEIHIDGP